MPSERARARWALLARRIAAIQGVGDDQAEADHDDVSVRRFRHFQLAQYGEHPTLRSDKGSWLTVRFPSLFNDSTLLSIHVCPESDSVRSLSELTGFNNTGNVCVWPSEEVLAFYCLRQRKMFAGHRVLEVGAGMAGLAAFALAAVNDGASTRPASITVTDGNARSVLNLHRIAKIAENSRKLDGVSVHITELIWSSLPPSSPHRGAYDSVLAADCLFFDEARLPLLQLLADALKPGGVFVSLAPARNALFTHSVTLQLRPLHANVYSNPADWSAYFARGKALFQNQLQPPRKTQRFEVEDMLNRAKQLVNVHDWWDIDVKMVKAIGQNAKPGNAVRCDVTVVGDPPENVRAPQKMATNKQQKIEPATVSTSTQPPEMPLKLPDQHDYVDIDHHGLITGVHLAAAVDNPKRLAALLKVVFQMQGLPDERFNSAVMAVLDTDFLDAAIKATSYLEGVDAVRIHEKLTKCERFDIAYMLADDRMKLEWNAVVGNLAATGTGEITATCDEIMKIWSHL